MQCLGVCPMVVRGVDLGDIIEVIFMYSSKPSGISHSLQLDQFISILGSAVAQCLTRDREAAGSSLTGVTALWSLSIAHLS